MDKIRKDQLPAFYLFKNLRLEDPFIQDSSIESFEFMQRGDSFYELQNLIPNPEYPEEPALLKLFIHRFGDVLPEDENDYWYDDTPGQLCEDIQDKDIFGDSYTILWVCPPNKQLIIDAIIEHLKAETRGFRDEILESHLIDIWNDFIDRIQILSESNDIYGSQIISEIKEELPRHINKLPNAPSESTWEEFESNLI